MIVVNRHQIASTSFGWIAAGITNMD